MDENIQQKKSNSIEWSVVIPTRNRPEALMKCIESVLNCNYDNYSVVVVDQSYSDANMMKIQNLANNKGKKVNYIDNQDCGPASSRNKGAIFSNAEYIAFIDDDCIAKPEWLIRLTQGFEQYPHTGIIMGSVLREVHDTTAGAIPGFEPNKIEVINSIKDIDIFDINLGMAANCAVRRSVFDTIGFFDEFYRCGEDWDLFFRALVHNIPLLIFPDAYVIHKGFRDWMHIIMVTNNYLYEKILMLIKLIRSGYVRFIPFLIAQILTAGYVNARHHFAMGKNNILKNYFQKYMYLLKGIFDGFRLTFDKNKLLFKNHKKRIAYDKRI